MMSLSISAARPDPFLTLTAAAAVLLALAVGWSAVDHRMVGDAQVWVKPAKFALSFIVHFATLALIMRVLSPEWREGRALGLTAGVMATAFLGEMAYIFVQAAQAQPSHFYVSDGFHSIMYRLMGFGAVLLILGPLVVAWAAVSDRAAALGPATRAGIGWGAAASFVLTMITAGTMGARLSHFVGNPPPGAPTLPFFGWSAAVGDLRPAHFVALHALQVLPLAGLLLDRAGLGAGAVRWVALGWGALSLGLYAQALMGLPLIRL
ncbi:MAG: hypothetical protein GC146_01450 [Limimaricola sp.]|uniref:hypothetical protein n=1 Tax=Limimaricola sp. TaxID=2211665 RepID=UPI001D72F232|nr:hypothetical protein [Limimaricola sp.]MBI1415864.1 hypothetical protein [Limimaricola sp.]